MTRRCYCSDEDGECDVCCKAREDADDEARIEAHARPATEEDYQAWLDSLEDPNAGVARPFL